MRTLLPFDELNVLREKLTFSSYSLEGKKKYLISKDDIIDEIAEMLIIAYMNGSDSAANDLGNTVYKPAGKSVTAVIEQKTAGERWQDRVSKYLDDGSVEEIMRVAETETHRALNQGGLETANALGARFKTYRTMMDDRVREAHDYLEGTTVGINEEFYTFDSDHAPAPGLFQNASNNVNCRCYLQYS